MRKIFVILIFQLILIGFVKSQIQKVSGYQFWFDNNYSNKTDSTLIVPVADFNLQTEIPTTGLSAGLHTFHIRFVCDSNIWSGVQSQFFQKLPSGTNPSVNKMTAYEYWVDNNYAGKTYSGITPALSYHLIDSLSFASATIGLHTFHIRFKDENGQWSSILSQFFQKLPPATSVNSKMSAYEYWIDNDYSNKVLSGFAPIQNFQLIDSLAFSSITNGLHTFHIRFKDENGQWSIILSQFFQKLPSVTSNIPNLVTAYKYWIDMSDTTVKNVKLSSPTNPYNLLTLLDLIHIPKGNHEIHFQFTDTLKQWSSVLTDTFYKYPTVIANFTASNMFLCDSGWVHFTNNSFDADTVHWEFDNGVTSNLENPSQYFNTYGVHPVMLIAIDTTKGVIDTLILNVSVIHHPIVNLGNDTSICPSGITLNAWNPNSTYLWSNLATDSVINVNIQGTYSVLVTNQYGCIAEDTIHINMNPAPHVELGNDTIICAYNSIILDAGAGFNTYIWNTGQSTQTITVSNPGIYSVEVFNSYGCTKTDSIHVLIDTCTIINELSENTYFSVYPNPNNGLFNVKAETINNEPVNFTITDLYGRLLYKKDNIIMRKGELFLIDASGFVNGIYMLHVSSTSAGIVKKIAIKH